jgi:hypothetical protein
MTAEILAPETIEATPVLPEVDTQALAEIEERVVANVSLGDLIRRGSETTEQASGWGYAGEACALSAAALQAKDLGWLD